MVADLVTQVAQEVHHIAPMVASAGGTSTPPALTADQMTTATGNIFAVVGQVLTLIVDHPIFTMFLVSSLIFTGIRIVRAVKRI